MKFYKEMSNKFYSCFFILQQNPADLIMFLSEK